MKPRVIGTLKSREEIESSIDIVDKDFEFSYFLSNKGQLLSLSNHIWDLCGKEINAVSVGRFNTGFDLMYVHNIVVDGCTICPIIYLQKEWING